MYQHHTYINIQQNNGIEDESEFIFELKDKIILINIYV